MASLTRCAPSHGCLAVVVTLAALASPRRFGASVAESSGPDWHVVGVSSLLPAAVCTAAKGASSSSALSVVNRHGPCSPLQSRGGAPSQREILDRDQGRVNSIHRRIHGVSASMRNAARASKDVALPAHWGWGTPLGINNYIISIGLGTPARRFSVEFDTGSDLSWVQCRPCKGCYEQQDPLFDPTQSSTYAALSCAARECQELLDGQTCSPDNKCLYEVLYGGGSYTNGSVVRDTLTLTPSVTIPGFVFGCGDGDNVGFGKLDGLIGLGRDKVSLSSQLAARYGALFSYCLPSSSSDVGYLAFGRAAPAKNTQFTAMLTRNDDPSSYYLDLVGIKVAGRKINISPAVFAAAGTIIDSGTAFTRLPPRAYAALRSSFFRYMGAYKKAPSLSYLDTCYDFTGYAAVRIPSVALVFAGGATVNLSHSGLLFVSNASQVCLAFAPNGDDTTIGILGNMQQKTFAVLYDVANQRIGFGANGCR